MAVFILCLGIHSDFAVLTWRRNVISDADASLVFAAAASHHWKKGSAVKSLKSLNASVRASLPESGEAICQSLAGFARELLGYNKFTKTFPPEPSPDERCQLRPLKQKDIMSDRRVFTLQSPSGDDGQARNKYYRFKYLCIADLEKHGISRITFDWKAPDSDPWNRTMAVFLFKHWQYANTQGAFKEAVPSENDEDTCIGIILRWMRGRAVDIRQGRRSPEKILRKETCRKKIKSLLQLFEYRKQSLHRVLLAANLPNSEEELLPSQDCCSETEWEPEKTHCHSIGLVWRSRQYASLLHQIDKASFKYCASQNGLLIASQRFDQCRIEATRTNPNAPYSEQSRIISVVVFTYIFSIAIEVGLVEMYRVNFKWKTCPKCPEYIKWLAWVHCIHNLQ
ncbi:uncharacterized protein MELLADRAFT_103594 [Melampsora larici-populina 98AG31]|uniref:Secreted protein n=1 Tax=Melampsora larici-populina (strain 98AG31 / pathotype 3-4-7) TaxID=747676 RepID=F4RBU9_MELLP|nr:uncharacterized protein MELLADRAFT_103594 [Melampsora larici-populina 98AG31]EGG10170.1 hypothetical protein MELLADRAFT_103594 [Melampsora larici-populina 98AG31]